VEHGILVHGHLLEGTDWCRRDEKNAWWKPGEFGTRPRAPKIDLLTGHWTAGEAGAGSYEDDGPVVVRNMKSRMSRTRPGQRLQVSVQFVIGACAPDAEYAHVWQAMDLGTSAATHVGRGEINARSIGVEVVSAGMPGSADVRKRPRVKRKLVGREYTVLSFYPGQLRSWLRLANALCGACLPGNILIPRQVPVVGGTDGGLLAHRMTLSQLRRWSGAMEHLHMDNTTKLDGGTLLIEHLLQNGWRGSMF
jgi:hypothetical protein